MTGRLAAWGTTNAASDTMVTIAVGGGGWKDILALAAAPFFVGWKLIMLPAVFRSSRSKTAWVRTERPTEGGVR